MVPALPWIGKAGDLSGNFQPCLAALPRTTRVAAENREHQKAATPFAVVAAFRSKGSYFLVSSVLGDMVSPDFFMLLFLDDFFFILVEVSVFGASWAKLVWMEAMVTLPTSAAQHAAIIRVRIFFSCWI
jgi:hypothetical protein